MKVTLLWLGGWIVLIPLYKYDRDAGMLGYPLHVWTAHHLTGPKV